MFCVSRAARQAVPRVAASAAKASRRTGTAGTLARLLPHKTSRAVPLTQTQTQTQCQCRSYGSSTPGDLSAGIAELARKQPQHGGSEGGGRWTLVGQGAALERSFRFKNFTKTWDFMTAVALQCKLKNHHPEWSNVYNTVFVRWTTHSAPEPGLSTKDIAMAKICDELGMAFGELSDEAKPTATATAAPAAAKEAAAPTNGAGPTCKMQSLADTAKGITGGDCCNHTAASRA